jgi:hypothetical protein
MIHFIKRTAKPLVKFPGWRRRNVARTPAADFCDADR